jgi:hypothetical protein
MRFGTGIGSASSNAQFVVAGFPIGLKRGSTAVDFSQPDLNRSDPRSGGLASAWATTVN